MNTSKLLWDLYALKRNEHKTPQQIGRLQQQKLRRILAFAYERSPYYRRAFAQAGIGPSDIATAPLTRFPMLDKAQLLSNFDQLITVPGVTQAQMRAFDAQAAVDRKPFLGRYHVVHSSGSTGKPGYFLYDQAAWNHMLLGIIRGALWGMPMPQILKLLARGPRIAYLAATDGRYGGAMAVGDGIEGVGGSQMYLDIKTPLAQWVERIRAFQPNMIIGYPSAIKILAELSQRGELELDLIRVVSCGEPLGRSLRAYLEQTLRAQVLNFYGASESLALGVEADPRQGMILFDDMNLIESVDGHMVLTCLYNFAQPLIRYRLSDCLTLHAPRQGAPCPFTRAVGLVGRSEDILWFSDPEGNREFLHPLAVEGFCVEGLTDYQFRQTGPAAFTMLAQTAPAADRAGIEGEMRRRMAAILKEKGLTHVAFSLGFVDAIPPDPRTGKKALIVRDAETEGMAV